MPNPYLIAIKVKVIAESIGEIANAIDSLLSIGQQDEYHKKVMDKLSSIENSIDSLRTELHRLQIRMDESFKLESEKNLIAKVRTFLETRNEFYNGGLTESERREEARDFLRSIANSRNKIMVGSHASFASVFYSLVPELELHKIANFSTETTIATINSYLDYFTACANPVFKDSPANVYFSALQEIETLKSQFPDWSHHPIERFWVLPFQPVDDGWDDPRGPRDRLRERSRTVRAAQAHYELTGSLDSNSTPAYTGVIHKQMHETDDTSGRQHAYMHQIKERMNSKISDGNVARDRYKSIKSIIGFLEASDSAARIAQDQTVKLLESYDNNS